MGGALPLPHVFRYTTHSFSGWLSALSRAPLCFKLVPICSLVTTIAPFLIFPYPYPRWERHPDYGNSYHRQIHITKLPKNVKRDGGPGRIRTCDQGLMRPLLLTTELRAQCRNIRVERIKDSCTVRSVLTTKMVLRPGFEPGTNRLKVCCSTKLSYRSET